MLTRAGICVPPAVTHLPYRVSGSTLTAVGRSRLLARWPGTRSRTLSCIPRAAQTVSGVYLKRTSSRDTSAPSALGVLNDYALYKSKHSLTQARQRAGGQQLEITSADAAIVHFIGLPFVRGPIRRCRTIHCKVCNHDLLTIRKQTAKRQQKNLLNNDAAKICRPTLSNYRLQ